MKKCPYCAEEIQDEAIKCRYCYSDLTVPRETALQQRPEPTTPTALASDVGGGTTPAMPSSAGGPPPPSTAAAAPPSTASESPAPTPTGDETTAASSSSLPNQPAADPDAGQIRYTHSGYRYVLGYGGDYFGLWDRQSPTVATERWPRTDDGWRAAWLRFVALEPKHVAVPTDGEPAASGPEMGSTDTDVVRYTHTGQRYLLGYGGTFFGIWDRQNPATPVERFPRTDDGWVQAWRRYTQIETHFAEVPATSGGEAASG